jgi:hypothetical protein
MPMRESTAVKYVRIYLQDLLKAMNPPFQLENHLGIKHNAPDLCFNIANRLVGVVEVKNPDENMKISGDWRVVRSVIPF